MAKTAEDNTIKLYNKDGEHTVSLLMTDLGIRHYKAGVSLNELQSEIRAILDIKLIMKADFS